MTASKSERDQELGGQGELVMERIRNTEIEEMYLNVPTAQINEGRLQVTLTRFLGYYSTCKLYYILFDILFSMSV